MARINFDDDVETQEEFWTLLRLVNGDRDSALGKLVRFFRLAQKRYGHGEAITDAELDQQGLRCMVDSGWAVATEGGYRAKGAAKYFAWYMQKIEAGKKGGRPLEAKPDGLRNEPSDNRPVSAANPPAPALAPSPAPAQKQESIYNSAPAAEKIPPEEWEVVRKAWVETLKHFKIERPLMADEERTMFQLIRQHGYKMAAYGLAGMRFEEKTNDYNPAKHVTIHRALDNAKFNKFVNLAAQKKSGAA